MSFIKLIDKILFYDENYFICGRKKLIGSYF